VHPAGADQYTQTGAHVALVVAVGSARSDALWRDAHRPDLCVAASRAAKWPYLLRGGMVRCATHGLVMTGTSNGDGHGRYRCLR
jgi:hypothetical protein